MSDAGPLGEFRIIAESENKLTCNYPGQLFPIVFERSEADRRAFELARRTIAVFNGWLSNDKADDRDTMSVIGSHLYSALFPGDIDKAFRALWGQRNILEDPPTLRIVLEFRDDAAWLAEMPWEFLYLPDAPGEIEGFFLCAQKRVILTRAAQLVPRERKQPRADDPIRILVILAQPSGEFEVSAKLVGVLDSLCKANPGQLELRTHIGVGRTAGVPGPSRKDLACWIADAEFAPDIVHFLGHGMYEHNNQPRLEKGKLALVDEQTGAADWCSDKDFADLFDPALLPKLVFLHACETGTTASYRGFKGLALSLIKRGIPNVVAMQYPVENAIANSFAKTFYEAALGGAPIDAAVQAGRQELGTGLTKLSTQLKPDGGGGNYSNRRFGSPIVFVQAWQGLSVFGRALGAATPAERDDTSPNSLSCPYPTCQKFHKSTSRFCDQGFGPLVVCASCKRLMTGDARVCGQCGTPRGSDVDCRPAAPAERPVATRLEAAAPALDRFRASADSSATHGGTAFTGRPGD